MLLEVAFIQTPEIKTFVEANLRSAEELCYHQLSDFNTLADLVSKCDAGTGSIFTSKGFTRSHSVDPGDTGCLQRSTMGSSQFCERAEQSSHSLPRWELRPTLHIKAELLSRIILPMHDH